MKNYGNVDQYVGLREAYISSYTISTAVKWTSAVFVIGLRHHRESTFRMTGLTNDD